MNGLNWFWIAIALTVPGVVGALVALPFWLTKQPILGNLVGTAVIFGAAIGFIQRERFELDALEQACIDRGFYCVPDPTPFTRYAIYAFIALFEVMAVFMISVKVEEKIRRRGYDPEWR